MAYSMRQIVSAAPANLLRPFRKGLEPLLDTRLAEAERQEAEHQQRRDARGREEPVALDRVRDRLAAVEGSEADRHRPADPAGGVPEEEAPPVHPPETGDPRGGEPE